MIFSLVAPQTTSTPAPNNNNKKSSHRRTTSVIGPLEKNVSSSLNAGMAKIVPATASEIAAIEAPRNDDNATIMGLIGGVGTGEDNQQLDIPIFKTEEGRYLATGTEYLMTAMEGNEFYSLHFLSFGRPTGERLDGSGQPTA